MSSEIGIESLMNLGFTQIEALVYTSLLEGVPQTGYGIAKNIAKPVANTYKALSSLEKRGAVIVDESDIRLVRAIAPEELLDHLESAFKKTKKQALDDLKKLHKEKRDDRIYQLKTVDQVYKKARVMLEEAERSIFLDLFPGPFTHLEADITKAVKRGIKVGLRTYGQVDIPGVNVQIPPQAEAILKNWPTQFITIACDGNQYMIGSLSWNSRSVHQCVWTSSAIVAWALFVYSQNYVLQTGIRSLVNRNASGEEIRSFVESWDKEFPIDKNPGYYSVRQRLRYKKQHGLSWGEMRLKEMSRIENDLSKT